MTSRWSPDRSHWYDRQGNPISAHEAGELLVNGEARRVGLDKVGSTVVSTVFLVMDHGFTEHGPPVLFETMTFDETHDERDGVLVDRYCTEAEALQGHADAVTLVRSTQADDEQRP